MKYKFEVLSEDNYRLSYKDKSFDFKSNVETIKELQGLIADARTQMVIDLAKKGTSIKELTIEKKENGKTYYDNTNVVELEKIYNEKITLQYFDDKSKKIFGMTLTELVEDIGLESAEESQKFATEFINCLSGKDFLKAQ